MYSFPSLSRSMYPAFLAQLRRDPTAFVQRVRRLCAQRIEGSTDVDGALSIQLGSIMTVFHQPGVLGDRVYYMLMKIERVPEIFVTLLQSDGFFRGGPVRAAAPRSA